MEINEITRKVIGCAIEVHKHLGPGLLESIYEKCLVYLLREKGFSVITQQKVPIIFQSLRLDCDLRLDLLVENAIIVELKAVKAIAPEHQAQIINYLNATGIEVGLLINFGNPRLEYKRFTRSKDYKHG